MKEFSSFSFLNLKLKPGRPEYIAQKMVSQAISHQSKPGVWGHINLNNYYQLHGCSLISEEPSVVLLPDGIGIQTAMFLFTKKWFPDLNGTDLFPLVAQEAEKIGTRIYLLGSETKVIGEAVTHIKNCYPALVIVGYECGYFSPERESEVVHNINKSGTDLLIVGMGAPRQEEFVLRQLSDLSVGAIWLVGGLFDFLSGNKSRAPKLLRKLRLEWLYRFIREPSRMWHRNLFVPIWFIFHILAKNLARRL